MLSQPRTPNVSWALGHLLAVFQYLKEVYKNDEEGLSTGTGSDRRVGYGFSLKEDRFSLDFRMKFFTVKEVRHWNRLKQVGTGRKCFCPS